MVSYLSLQSFAGAGLEREPDQDLVPEQAGQAEEGLGGQGRSGQDAGGPGTLQPSDRVHGGGGGLRHAVLVYKTSHK